MGGVLGYCVFVLLNVWGSRGAGVGLVFVLFFGSLGERAFGLWIVEWACVGLWVLAGHLVGVGVEAG